MTITVWGDDERAMRAEANADARDDAQWEFENTCECGQPKPINAATCLHRDCMTDDEYDTYFAAELAQVIA